MKSSSCFSPPDTEGFSESTQKKEEEEGKEEGEGDVTFCSVTFSERYPLFSKTFQLLISVSSLCSWSCLLHSNRLVI